MNKQEKKLRKLNSIEIMDNLKVKKWERNDVYKDISIYEWVEWKSKKVGRILTFFKHIRCYCFLK